MHTKLPTLFALCLALGSASVLADELSARHAREVAVCNSGQSNQSRAACLDEARSAYAAARKGLLADDPVAERANRTERCEVLKGSEMKACKARMRGLGTVSGSVEAGGLYRELTVVTPAAPAASAPDANAQAPAPR